jgi:hypothetical protein
MLKECYGFYLNTSIDRNKLIEEYCNSQNIKFSATKSITSKIVNAIFCDLFASRRSMYATMLKLAIQNKVELENFINWIIENDSISSTLYTNKSKSKDDEVLIRGIINSDSTFAIIDRYQKIEKKLVKDLI